MSNGQLALLPPEVRRLETARKVGKVDTHKYIELCKNCELRKEIRLLRWHIKELVDQLQGQLKDGDPDHT